MIVDKTIHIEKKARLTSSNCSVFFLNRKKSKGTEKEKNKT